MADHPTFISLPSRDSGQPLRSALKQQPSRPASPSQTSSPPSVTSPGSRPASLAYFARTPPAMSAPLPTSPPPLPLAAGFAPKVSFDTFENPVASMFSYTLRVKTDGYERTRATRVFLCASSPDASGAQALDWALDSLAQDGDELVVFRGVPEDVLEKDHESCREEARELMRMIQEKSIEYDPDRKLNIIVEFIAGKVTDTIDRLIALYRPDSVVVGTRGQRSALQTWSAAFAGATGTGMGSVSKYCLSHSPVPIIVVSPEAHVRKAIAKRKADPRRGKHFDTTTPGAKGGHAGVPMSWTMTR